MKSQGLTGESGIVILVLLADAGHIAHDGNVELVEELRVTHTRTLKDLPRNTR